MWPLRVGCAWRSYLAHTGCRTMSTESTAYERLQKMSSVLLVQKKTRWEHESDKYQLEGKALEDKLLQNEYPLERIQTSHKMHKLGIEQMTTEFRKRNIAFESVEASELEDYLYNKGNGNKTTALECFDAVFSGGGDGTALQTALQITSNAVALVPVNTDPALSTGMLCAYKIGTPSKHVLKSSNPYSSESSVAPSGKFSQVLDWIQEGSFEFHSRSRIQVRSSPALTDFTTLGDNDCDEVVRSQDPAEVLDVFALNEVFYAERDASRPAVHDTTVQPWDRRRGCEVEQGDDGAVRDQSYVQRSSGVIVCTGTGSTAWMSSAAKVSEVDIKRILVEASRTCGIPLPFDSETLKIASAINKDCIFPGDSNEVQYFVREPVQDGWYGRKDSLGRPLSSSPRRGFAKLVKLRAKGWSPVLTVDGLKTYHIPYGTQLTIQVDPSVALQTIRFKTPSK